MTFKPAHKETDPDHLPGQIRNDITLGDYIERKMETPKKKLTFDEWYYQQGLDYGLSIKAKMMDCWDASRRNQ